jgi:hypothetical protein
MRTEYRVVWDPGNDRQVVTACDTLDQARELLAAPRSYPAEIQSRDVDPWVPIQKPNQAFYFGCRDRAGHYLFDRFGRSVPASVQAKGPIPWEKIDGAIPPSARGLPSHAPQGVAALHHRDGWTALGFWDRSVDHRGGSNSAFFFDRLLTFDLALSEAREFFPWVFARLDFEVIPEPTSRAGQLPPSMPEGSSATSLTSRAEKGTDD